MSYYGNPSGNTKNAGNVSGGSSSQGGFYAGSNNASGSNGGYSYSQQQPQSAYGSEGSANYNTQQWQSNPPQSASQPQQHQMYSGTSLPPQPSNSNSTHHNVAQPFWNPATAATMAAVAGSISGSGGFSNDTMLDLASSAGKSFLQSGSARMIPGLESTMLTLRHYFAVDNKYVLRKMQKVLFPFLSKQWQRQEREPGTPDTPAQYDLPYLDENAPDLYVPVMSLITYVLLCAVCYGKAGQFNPEVLPDVTTKCFMTQVLEVLAIRFGFYTMQVPVPFLDLFAYTGYKYLGLALNMLVALVLGTVFALGTRAYYVTLFWTASAMVFFMLKTMAHNIPLRTAATGPKREIVVIVFAALQLATMWFMSQTKFL
jgi:hypothetical protein